MSGVNTHVTITYSVTDGVATITLSRREQRNTVTSAASSHSASSPVRSRRRPSTSHQAPRGRSVRCRGRTRPGGRCARREREPDAPSGRVCARRRPRSALDDTLVAALDTGAPTLLRGDVHAGNVFYVDGTRGGLLDWQLALRSNWSLDVGYILSTALTPAQRAAHERDLLRGYLAPLSALGVPDTPSFDDAWLRYRQSALCGIAMWLITAAALHSDEVQAENLRRCLSAGDELETLAALGL